MRKISIVVGLLVVMLALPAFAMREGGPVQERSAAPFDGRWRWTITLYNGQDCSTAKIRVFVSDEAARRPNWTQGNGSITIEWQTPGGTIVKQEVWVPNDIGSLNSNGYYTNGQWKEFAICVNGEQGMGTIHAVVGLPGFQTYEIFFAEYEVKDRFISFGRI